MNNPAFNLDAEKSLLGALLLPSEKFNPFDETVGIVTAKSFHSPAHAQIFEVIQAFHRDQKPVDVVTVKSELERRGQLEQIGGVPYLGQILETVPHLAHAQYYAELVREAADRRRLGDIAYTITHDLNTGCDTTDIISNAEQSLHSLMEGGAGGEALCIGDVLMEMETATESTACIPTGFHDMDDMVDGGLRGGWLVIEAARPSIGKTAFMGNIALNVARRGNPALVFSLEQTRKELAERFLSSLSGLEASILKSRKTLDSHQEEQLLQAKNKLAKLPIIVNDQGGLKVGQIAAGARLQKRRGGLGLIIVDYLQLVEPDDRQIPREQQVATISRRLKLIAKELDCPVICLAQLNRAVETRENKRPRLSDLRESGAIEQDADVVMFLDRPATYGKGEETEAHVIIGKNRHGKTGDVRLHWNGPTMTFKSAAPMYQEGWPT